MKLPCVVCGLDVDFGEKALVEDDKAVHVDCIKKLVTIGARSSEQTSIRGQTVPPFVQISAVEGFTSLYGLDKNGRVWSYRWYDYPTSEGWELMSNEFSRDMRKEEG